MVPAMRVISLRRMESRLFEGGYVVLNPDLYTIDLETSAGVQNEQMLPNELEQSPASCGILERYVTMMIG